MDVAVGFNIDNELTAFLAGCITIAYVARLYFNRPARNR